MEDTVADTFNNINVVNNNLQPSFSTQKQDPIISLIDEDPKQRHNPTIAEKEKIVLWPNEFTVILLIDTGESSSLRFVLCRLKYKNIFIFTI